MRKILLQLASLTLALAAVTAPAQSTMPVSSLAIRTNPEAADFVVGVTAAGNARRYPVSSFVTNNPTFSFISANNITNTSYFVGHDAAFSNTVYIDRLTVGRIYGDGGGLSGTISTNNAQTNDVLAWNGVAWAAAQLVADPGTNLPNLTVTNSATFLSNVIAAHFIGDASGLSGVPGTLAISNWFTPAQFGAQGGATIDPPTGHDDTAAIQACLDQATNGAAVVLLNLKSLITTTLVMRANTLIMGMPGSCQVLTNNANCPMLVNELSGSNIISRGNYTVSGTSWYGNGTNQSFQWNNDTNMFGTPGIWFSGFTNLVIRDSKIFDSRRFALWLSNGKDFRVDNLDIAWRNTNEISILWPNANNHDGVHLSGPLRDGLFTFLTIRNGNDSPFGVVTDESSWVTNLPVAFAQRGYIGDCSISNIVVQNLLMDNCSQGLIFSTTQDQPDPAYKFPKIEMTFRNISGYMPYLAGWASGINVSRLEFDGYQVSGPGSLLDVRSNPADTIILNRISKGVVVLHNNTTNTTGDYFASGSYNDWTGTNTFSAKTWDIAGAASFAASSMTNPATLHGQLIYTAPYTASPTASGQWQFWNHHTNGFAFYSDSGWLARLDSTGMRLPVPLAITNTGDLIVLNNTNASAYANLSVLENGVSAFNLLSMGSAASYTDARGRARAKRIEFHNGLSGGGFAWFSSGGGRATDGWLAFLDSAGMFDAESFSVQGNSGITTNYAIPGGATLVIKGGIITGIQ